MSGRAVAEKPASAIEFAVEPFSRCAADVLAFRNVNRPVAAEQAYFEWRYHRPCAHEPLILWARDGDGRPVGAASVIPHDYFFLDGVYPVGLLGDISVLPSSRGQGVAGRMLSFLARHEALRALRACVVLPNDEAEGPLQRAGWHGITTIHRFIKLGDARLLLERKFGAVWPVRWAGVAADALLRALSPERAAHARGRYDTRDANTFDARYDTLWKAAMVPGRVLAVRDAAYLRWRFVEHPLGSHRVFELIEGGELRGYVVFHHEEDLAVVDDYLVAQPEVVVPLFALFFERLGQDARTARIQVRTHRDARLALPWRRFGFVRRKDSQRVMLLDPAAPQTPLAHLAAEWHVTPADKDV